MTSARTFSLLAALASPLFLCTAVAGWLYGVWPANPATLTVAAIAVISGPLLGIYHVASSDSEPADGVLEVVTATITPAPVVNIAEARARAFHNWRDSENPVIQRRERERRANRYMKAS